MKRLSILWLTVAIGAAMICSGPAAFAQGEQKQQPQNRPDAAEDTSRPAGTPAQKTPLPEGTSPRPPKADVSSTLWQDIQLMRVTSHLSADGQQVQNIISVLQNVQQEKKAVRKARQQLWKQNFEVISDVINAWIAGVQLDPDNLNTANDVASEARDYDGRLHRVRQDAASAIFDILDQRQRNAVETPQEQRARRRREARYEGEPTLAKYIARRIEIIRTLMPDEYNSIRRVEAGRIASHVVGFDSPDYPDVMNATVDLMDQLMNMTDEQYGRMKPTLEDEIRNYLNISRDFVLRPVHYSQFIDWIDNPRTIKYLKVYGKKQAEPVPPSKKAGRTELQKALDRADIVTLLNDLGLGVGQLRQLNQIAKSAATDQQTNTAAVQGIIGSARASLRQMLTTMIAAKQLSGEQYRRLQKLREDVRRQRACLNQVMTIRVRSVLRTFAPRQGQYFNWTVPSRVRGAGKVQQLAERRLREDRALRDALDLMETLRTPSRTKFFDTRREKAGRFLKTYVAVESRRFQRLHEQIVDDLKPLFRMSKEEWNHRALPIAMTIARRVEQLPPVPQQQSDNNDNRYSWYYLRDLLLADAMVPVTKQMVQARERAGTGQSGAGGG